MSALPEIRFVIKDYDFLAPLACGDVKPEGFGLILERDTPGALDRTLNDKTIDAGELSLSRYVMSISRGNPEFTGLPFFAYRAFRQRCYFIKRESAIKSLGDLKGANIGINEWPATGSVWTRALLLDAGVPLESIRWQIAPIENAGAVRRPQGLLPPWVKEASLEATLVRMLLSGEVGAIMCPRPPKIFYEKESPVIRLFPDYKSEEIKYYGRTGLYPPHHLAGIRRRVTEKYPWIAKALFDALEKSRLRWRQSRREWAESTPWLLNEFEENSALMGDDFEKNGIRENMKAIEAFCREELSQKLIEKPLNPEDVFAEFAGLAGAA